MKYAFVRFNEIHEEPHRVSTGVLLVSGVQAESPEAFVTEWQEGNGVTVKTLDWCEVPENWDNVSSGGVVNDTLEAILALDALGETPVVSDLLATIFAEGYKLGQKKGSDLATALRALLES
ncbi:hypothetical protein CO057_01665 [Candidatus Uhrbacteria bacterium CG_4_9_14_0_2_um_filter_41_50]|uniref:Uncharacterized protein n=1 Tax=Candidatus Uhrbacteria bacterium CG_4_9_14_0_2_um_filter_41_50 TaxID=1975031 RepID=A0A2M8EPH0_9BACT|nr:MAG: hypothetical protein COZ45_00845 [Candidatus Uhrbacteria bacterium CG_4_10_14_3_um_filter_41_21]PIZ55405.1 MAG: hypothetical protein COY24_00350 [Candidatus Uhrbacteria bacterium CG_4_10_14_0_2_um_filter_41_21]PJB85075.1 MAG: hypothetical protein CO086_00165 [Candidatus Uhrbacteria bacterium CG_4_9_14_0_8_um_filter_41_16]PJC24636.1 MAG: hypothetical protein CO057_01665 [Candidatus Uhrbacteria bacterium CG_4_9_14_0_2_um_filter_41_50]PJE75178.1 MAG: hypothetical protein COV03_01405 [Candi